MATVLRNTEPSLAAVAAAHNDLKAQIGAGSHFHLDKSEVKPSSASATDLPSAITRLQNLMAVYNFHQADLLACKAVDAHTLAESIASVKDLASAETAANDLKAKYNLHIADTGSHYNADATNAVATANATDLATLEALVNSIYTELTAHLADGPSAASLRLVGA